MAVGDVFQVNLVGLLHGQQIVNTFHYRETATGAGNASSSLGVAFAATVFPPIKAMSSDEMQFDKLVIQKIRPLPPLVAVENATIFSNGSLAGGSCPSSVAMVISKKTAVAGRAFRGRTYFAGVPTGGENDSLASTAQLGLMSAAANAMDNNLSEGTFTWAPVVFHRGDGTTTDITQCVPREVLRNQRRRQVTKGV